MTEGYEAIFPLDSSEWKTITLRWDVFVQNYLPWSTKLPRNDTTSVIDPNKIALIGFGFGRYLHHFYPAQASFQIRNIRLQEKIPVVRPKAFTQGWSHTKSLLAQKKPIKILLMGDSLTDFAGDRSYGYHLGQKIKKSWGSDCEVINAAVAGHSSRGGLIVLPRSLRAMPNPDLVCILFGANDCKSVGLKPDFNEAVFAANLEALIDRIRNETGGSADICLINGVPRLKEVGGASSGEVERIVNGVKVAAEHEKTAFVNTFDAYLALSAVDKKNYYKDTVHQTPAGWELLGRLVFDELRKPVTPAMGNVK